MIKKKTWRYYCEFCKKSGCSGGHIRKHELHCTLNPDRECGMCDILDEITPDINELLKILPDPHEYIQEDDYGVTFGNLNIDVEKVMPKIRELTNDCPACIMSALRIKGIPVPMVESFSYRKESESIFHDYNEEKYSCYDY